MILNWLKSRMLKQKNSKLEEFRYYLAYLELFVKISPILSLIDCSKQEIVLF